MNELLHNITGSFSWFIPELILILFLFLLLISSLFRVSNNFLLIGCLIGFGVSCASLLYQGLNFEKELFTGMLHNSGFSSYLKILIDLAGILTCIISLKKANHFRNEFFFLITAIVLGGHLLVMTTNFLMVFLAMEIISISSFVLAGFSFTKTGSEGSLKYFLFGATASAVMLYGFSLLYGITGSIDFSRQEFITHLLAQNSTLAFAGCFMVLAGFLYKIAAVPMHPWAPDVYEGAPVPVIAFLSVAPKVAGLGVLVKFILAIHLYGQSRYDWQVMVTIIALLTITVGNFSALRQENVKRLMAYSSIAQSGFLLIGPAAFLPQGIYFMLFYAAIYLLMNFLVFLYIDSFEKIGISTISGFRGAGKKFLLPSLFMLVGLIALTGLPPTAGFSAKLFIFSALWQAYELTGKNLLLWLLIFGLLNTVISLFYYLRIPYFAFLKEGEPAEKQNIITFENLLGLILVLLILILFFQPGLLMGWINKINFVF